MCEVFVGFFFGGWGRGEGFDVVSLRSAVQWAGVNCLYGIDCTGPRPLEMATVHVLLHLDEYPAAEVVCGKEGASFSLVMEPHNRLGEI